MKIINQYSEVLTKTDYDEVLRLIEMAGRICYKSKGDKSRQGLEKFISKLIALGHESVLEHFSISVKFVTSRTVSHQLVRHRLASFSQESQRYCRYENEVVFINPNVEIIPELENIEKKYIDLLNSGVRAQDARSILPNCTKTEFIMTANIREWRHILNLRCSKHAQPETREIMLKLLEQLQLQYPVFFVTHQKSE